MAALLDKVTIANQALDNIDSKALIEDFNETSVEARRIRRWYDTCRKEVLAGQNWTFARTTKALSTHNIAAPELRGWAYRYQVPADMITARRIENPSGDYTSDPIPYDLEIASDKTLSLVTNQDEAVLIYTFDQESVDLFSAPFATCLGHLIASHIAGPLTRKASKKEEQLKLYNFTLDAAGIIDAGQEIQSRPREADSIEART